MKSVVLACAAALFGGAFSQELRIFVTEGDQGKGVFNGGFNGAQGIDSICRQHGGENFVGLASSITEKLDGINRFHDGYQYNNYADGVPIGDKTTMFSAIDPSFISLSSFQPLTGKTGVFVNPTPNTAWTGTTSNGLASLGTGGTCESWTINTNARRGESGSWAYPAGEDYKWISTANNDCNNAGRLYCIEQALVVCVFATTTTVPVGAGAQALHDACNNAGPGSFSARALIDTTTEDILEVFPQDEGSYLIINTAGQVINSLRYDLVNEGTIKSDRYILTRQQTQATDGVWTGYGGSNCDDFTSNANTDTSIIGDGTAARSSTLFNSGSDNCDQEHQLYCVQTSQISTASVHGDPHFQGFDGSKYNFMGADGEIFAIISDVGFALNAEFRRMKVYDHDGTWMTKVGVRVQDETLVFDPRFGLLVNGDIVSTEYKSQKFTATKTEKGFQMVSEVAGYSIDVVAVSFRTEAGLFEHFLDVQVSLLSKPVKPHGVLGQTASFLAENKIAEPVTSNDDNGKGVVQGIWSDYLVHDGLTGTDFNFSAFAAAHPGHRVSFNKETRSSTRLVGSFVGLSGKF